MKRIEYKNNDYYLKKNTYEPKEINNSFKFALPGYNQPLNYSTLELTNNLPSPPISSQNSTGLPTRTSLPDFTGGAGTDGTSLPGFTGGTVPGFTGGAETSLLGFTGGTVPGGAGTAVLGFTAGAGTARTTVLGFTGGAGTVVPGFTGGVGYTGGFVNTIMGISGQVLGNSSQCPQSSNYLNNSTISNLGVSQNLYCNSPIDSSIRNLINADLAYIDTNGNVVYKNLATQSISNSLPSTNIGVSTSVINTGMNFTGSTGTGFNINTNYVGYTDSKQLTSEQVAKSTSISIAQSVSKKLQCNDQNQICIYESYEGQKSIQSYQKIIDKQQNLSKPVGVYQWIGADKSFNVGYNQITVAVIYSLTNQVTTATSFTLFATNSGYVFVNDVMYIINNNANEVGENNIKMLANIPVPINKDGSKTTIDILLPANSAILINNNTLFNTNTEWTSKTYDLMKNTLSFEKIDPIDFIKNTLNKKVISNKQNIYIIQNLTVSLNVEIDPLSALISNSSTYKSYSDNDIKNDISIKSVIYSPVEDLYVNGDKSSINFAIYCSNNFNVYMESNGILTKLTESLIYNNIIVNSSLTLKSLSVPYLLKKGVNRLYVVAPENTMVYIPYIKIDGINNVFSNKELSKSTDYKDVNKINITNQFWRYLFVNIPYIQFNYLTLYKSINSNFDVKENYTNYTNYTNNQNKYKRIDDFKFNKNVNKNGNINKNVNINKNGNKNVNKNVNNMFYNIIPSSIKDMFSIFTSNGLEHFDPSASSEEQYSLLEDKIIKNDYIVNSEKIREQIKSIMNNLNSDQQYNLDIIKKNYRDLLINYNTIINSIQTKISDSIIKNSYNSVINDTNSYTLKSIIDTEKNNLSMYNLFNPVYTQYNTNYNNVINTYNNINSNSDILKKTVQNSTNNDTKSLDDIYNQLDVQLKKLNTAIKSDKYDDVKKEFNSYQIINKLLQDKIASINKTQIDYNANIGTLDGLIYNLTTQSKTFTDYVTKTVTPTINNYKLIKAKYENINKYLTEATTIINSPDFSCTLTQNYVAVQGAINICTFIKLVDNYIAQYNLLYIDALTGIKAKIQKYIDLNTTIDNILTTNFNKKLPNLSTTTNITNFTDSLDFSSIWNSTDGINAINVFKTALNTYLTSYLRVMNKLNSTFGFSVKITKIDSSLITSIGGVDNKSGLMKKNSEIIKVYSTIELTKFNTIATKATLIYNTLKDEVTKMFNNTLTIDDTKINGYLTTLKNYNTAILENSKLYTSYETKIKDYVISLSQCSDTFNVSDSSSTSDIFNTNAIINKLAIMLNYKRNSSNTSVQKTSMESFSNYKEHLTNFLTILKVEDFNRLNSCEAVVSGIPSNILSSYGVSNGVWIDKYSASSSLDIMEGYLSIITAYQSNISINDIESKIYTNNQPFTLFVNDINIPIKDNKYKINIKNGINMIQVRIDLSTANKKLKSRYLLFSAIGTNVNITTNNISQWKYMFENNRYMKSIPKIGNSTSSCDTICLNNNFLCNNANVTSGTSTTVYDCNVIGINNINCNCLSISSNESFTNQVMINEHFTKTPKVSSNYGREQTPLKYTNLSTKKTDFLKNNKISNSIILHKAPYKGSTYLTGMTIIDTDNRVYPVGTAYQDDVESRLYNCKSGFIESESNDQIINGKSYMINARLKCNDPIIERDIITYMDLIKKNSKNIVYGKAENVRYNDNTLFEDTNLSFTECPKKCNDTPNCIGYITEKIKNVCTNNRIRSSECPSNGIKSNCDQDCDRRWNYSKAKWEKKNCKEYCYCKICNDQKSTTGCAFKTKFTEAKKEISLNYDTYYIKASNNNSESTVVPSDINSRNYFDFQS